jgi:hypothetical protein
LRSGMRRVLRRERLPGLSQVLSEGAFSLEKGGIADRCRM